MGFITPLPAPLRLLSPEVLIATWGGAGLLRPAPGTWGSLAALPFAWLAVAAGGPAFLLVLCLFVFGAGYWASHRYMSATGEHDASPIVIDEVVGQWLALLFSPLNIWAYLLAFVYFRLFDILKPWPIRWIDRSIEGAFGVMIDDVAAGLAALIFTWATWTYLLR